MRKGFTLVEALTVVAIIVVLVMMLIPAITTIFSNEPAVTRSGVVVYSEMGIDQHYSEEFYYVDVDYDGIVLRHRTIEKIYIQMFPQQRYKITTKNNWIVEVSKEE